MNGFTRKKVKSLTLGERLRKMREDRRISLNEAAKCTRIQTKYLEFLENGEYDKLPADVYVRGFVGSYAEYLGGDVKKLVMLFEKERGIRKNIEKTAVGNSGEKKINVSGVIITPKIMGAVGVVVVFLLAFFYLYKEFHSFVSMPRLVIKHPLMTHETVASGSIVFEGVTDRESEVVINEIKISVNEDGEFSQEISLKEGVNIVSVKSVNRFGKETVKEFFINSDRGQDVNVDFDKLRNERERSELESMEEAEVDEDLNNESDASDSVENVTENAEADESEKDEVIVTKELEIRAKKNPVDVIVRESGINIYSGKVDPDSPQKIVVKGDVLVTSDDGNDTVIYVDGVKMGLLSNQSGEVNDVLIKIK